MKLILIPVILLQKFVSKVSVQMLFAKYIFKHLCSWALYNNTHFQSLLKAKKSKTDQKNFGRNEK
jgi:hypothetical protein